MKSYLRDELVRFLKGVDAAVARPTDIVIIGGAAAAIHYKFSGGTRDIDTWTNVDQDLARAVRRAHETTGLDVPFERSVSPMVHMTSNRGSRGRCRRSRSSRYSCQRSTTSHS